MDNLIKELIEDFKKQENKVEKEEEKISKASKIVAKVNEEGIVEVLGVNGSKSALLSTICLILHNIADHSDDSAKDMAKIILIALEMEKEMHD